jgi:hypothetical protein
MLNSEMIYKQTLKFRVGAIHELPLPMFLAIETIADRTCIQQCPVFT